MILASLLFGRVHYEIKKKIKKTTLMISHSRELNVILNAAIYIKLM